MDLHRIHSHKYFRGGKIKKSFLLGLHVYLHLFYLV